MFLEMLFSVAVGVGELDQKLSRYLSDLRGMLVRGCRDIGGIWKNRKSHVAGC